MMFEENIKILVVDDESNNLWVMKQVLRKKYKLYFAKMGETALDLARKHRPDLILLDIMMPDMDGYEVCRKLKADPETTDIPVVFVTAMTEVTNERKGFAAGAVDYITKPIVPGLVRARIHNHVQLARRQHAFRDEVRRATAELRESQRAAVFMLGEAGHYNDTDTGAHVWRMAAYAATLARARGWSLDHVELLELASPLHDTGKIGIPDSILKAPRALTPDEWAIMKTHTTIGGKILSKSDTPLFAMAAEIALNHHEKWDGSGYPNGLKGKAIPESARIVAIADVFDALTVRRPYKDAWPIEKAMDHIREARGRHFDPELVDLFARVLPEMLEVKQEWDRNEKNHVKALKWIDVMADVGLKACIA